MQKLYPLFMGGVATKLALLFLKKRQGSANVNVEVGDVKNENYYEESKQAIPELTKMSKDLSVGFEELPEGAVSAKVSYPKNQNEITGVFDKNYLTWFWYDSAKNCTKFATTYIGSYFQNLPKKIQKLFLNCFILISIVLVATASLSIFTGIAGFITSFLGNIDYMGALKKLVNKTFAMLTNSWESEKAVGQKTASSLQCAGQKSSGVGLSSILPGPRETEKVDASTQSQNPEMVDSSTQTEPSFFEQFLDSKEFKEYQQAHKEQDLKPQLTELQEKLNQATHQI